MSYSYQTNFIDNNSDVGSSFITKTYLFDVYPNLYSSSNLYAFGYAAYGQLGDGTIVAKSSPIQIGSLTNWKSVSSGNYYIHVIKIDGTLWSWGYNNFGQLGIDNVTNKSSPVQIGSLTNWKSVSCGNHHSLAIKTDGTLWGWGRNDNGRLGDNTVAHKSSPVQIGSLTNWKSVSCGYYHTLAVKTDGTLWGWGRNDNGQIGDGTITQKSSPIQIGSLTNWKSVSCGAYHSHGIKTNGTLWSWGYNNFGQLGDGTITQKSSPVQIGSLTNWKSVSCGAYHSHGIKTNGTLWSCGYNNYGQLGDGTIAHKSSPLQIGNLTNWKSVNSIDNHSLAIKTDGTLWSWGYNNYGQLGDGSTSDKSSPIQIGSLTNWKSIACGANTSYAITEYDSYFAKDLLSGSETWDLLVTTSDVNQTYTIDINAGTAPLIYIDWDDGTLETITSTGLKTHTYATARSYVVKLRGSFSGAGNIRLGSDATNRARLKQTGIVPTIPGLISFQNTFQNCTGLTSIPTDLFRYNTAVSTSGFSSTFQGCTGLTGAIPTDLFRYNVLVSTSGFYQTFYGCTGLTSIPTDLFRYNTLVSTNGFSYTFYGCTGLTTIPTDLFKYNTLVSTMGFYTTFYTCNELSLVADIFGQSDEYATRFVDKICNFNQAFGISGFTGTQGIAPPLWEYDYGNIIELDVSPVVDWATDDVITGQTSAATCVIVSKVNATSYRVKKVFGTFTLGEVIGVTGNADKLADQGITRPTFLETMALSAGPVTPWVAGDIITGQTSGATCTIVSQYDTLTYTVKLRSATYTLGEIIGVTGTPAKLVDQTAGNPLFYSVPYAVQCFTGHSISSVSNYADIPASWR